MPASARSLVCASLIAVACAEETRTVLPPIHLPPDTGRSAFIVDANQHARVHFMPSQIVRGAGEGAETAMIANLDGLGKGSGEGTALMLLMLPVTMPIAAAVGAGMAHSQEEVDAALDAIKNTAQDAGILGAIDRKVAAIVRSRRPDQWPCIVSDEVEPSQACAMGETGVTLKLGPDFKLIADGRYSPDLYLEGQVTGRLRQGDLDVMTLRWGHRALLGNFFELGADGGAKLRSEIDRVVELFALKIADDLFLNPKEDVAVDRRDAGRYVALPVLPEDRVGRILQQVRNPTAFTHGIVEAFAGAEEVCTIAAIDGEPFASAAETNQDEARWAPAGDRRITVTCEQLVGAVSSGTVEREITIPVAAGRSYRTDGRTYEIVPYIY